MGLSIEESMGQTTTKERLAILLNPERVGRFKDFYLNIEMGMGEDGASGEARKRNGIAL